jgi:uridylate kinase
MKRILLKLSGETLGENGFSLEKTKYLASEIKNAKDIGVQIALVLGGGNIWRGRDNKQFGFFPAHSDAIGMMSTFLNALVLKNILTQMDVPSVIFSPDSFSGLTEKHNIEKEISALKSGKIVMFAGGTGAPFFTTDSAAVLRALEIRADAVLKGTKVNGIYESDPNTNPGAKKFKSLSFSKGIHLGLKVMDMTAFTLAKEHNLPIFVFRALQKNAISSVLTGKGEGTWVKNEQ